MKKIISLSLVAFISASSASLAADLVVDDSAIEQASPASWGAFYVGAQTGLVVGTFDDEFPNAPLASVGTGDLTGATFGAFAGWNLDLSGLVLGVEADANVAMIGGEATNLGGETMSVDLGWTSALRGRAGVYLTDDTLLYAAAGLAAADVTMTIDSLTGEASDVLWGWTAGLGVEVDLADNVFGRVEYRYSDYGQLDYVVGGVDPGTVDIATQAVNVGLAYRF